MQIQTAGWLEKASHLDHAHPKPAQERRHILARRDSGRVDDRMNPRPVVLYLVDPVGMHVFVPTPTVNEPSAPCQAVWRRVKVLVLVERWIGRYQINSLGVHAPQKAEVVPVKQRPVLEVALYQVALSYLLSLPAGQLSAAKLWSGAHWDTHSLQIWLHVCSSNGTPSCRSGMSLPHQAQKHTSRSRPAPRSSCPTMSSPLSAPTLSATCPRTETSRRIQPRMPN